jgi:hypothetical protein
MGKVTLSLTIEQLSIIDRAIQELPMKIAFPLIRDINNQIDAFMNDRDNTQNKDSALNDMGIISQ